MIKKLRKGHLEPHIHINYGNQNHAASYSISDGRKLAGNLNNRYEKDVKEWISKHQESLVALWNTAQKGEPVNEIIVGIQNA